MHLFAALPEPSQSKPDGFASSPEEELYEQGRKTTIFSDDE